MASPEQRMDLYRRIAAIRISGNRDISRNTDGGNGEDTRGGVDFGQCVKQADLALYESKRQGKNRFRFYEEPGGLS